MSQKKAKINRVLIANRGEIAVRVARTLRAMNITPVAVYSDADRLASHVLACHEAYPIGPAAASESYLHIERLLDLMKAQQIDAVHPGYGFLSENAEFADAVVAAGKTFIGPPAQAMRAMGSKTAARERMIAAKVPVVPGSDGPVASPQEAVQLARGIGYPIMLKASAGGGGKGMRIVHDEKELPGAFRAASSEAKSAFGDATVYVEKALVRPRHVEIQILSGPDGKAIWLGERECSMQRRHQKVIEETPSPAIDEATRRSMGEVACRAADAVSYVGAGTVEFLLDSDENFYFLEMNTRLQVEHPITELCCGVDLVEAQVRIAQGEPLRVRQEDVERRGHAIEARLYAEDPTQNFLPSPGHIKILRLPEGPGIRVDAGLESGLEVPRYYDPMVAKIIAWAEDREGARRRLVRALEDTVIRGIVTNAQYLRGLLESEPFISGAYHTSTLAELPTEGPEPPDALVDLAITALTIRTYERDQKGAHQSQNGHRVSGTGWRQRGWRVTGGL